MGCHPLIFEVIQPVYNFQHVNQEVLEHLRPAQVTVEICRAESRCP
jgi:hypothetical protein